LEEEAEASCGVLRIALDRAVDVTHTADCGRASKPKRNSGMTTAIVRFMISPLPLSGGNVCQLSYMNAPQITLED